MGGFNYQSWLNNTQHFATGDSLEFISALLTPFGLCVYEHINKPTPKQVFSPKSRAEGTVILFTPLCAVSLLWLQI